MNTNMLRITGMASGMDTESIVQNMMKAERMKVDKYEQNKTRSEWKKSAYNAVNKDLANFVLNAKKELGLTKTTSTGTIFNTSHMDLSYVKKATSSSETIANATATAKAMNGTFTVKIEELATNSTAQIQLNAGENFGNEVKLEINGKAIELSSTSGVSADELAKAINDISDLGVRAFAQKDDIGKTVLFLQSKKEGDKFTIAAGQGSNNAKIEALAKAYSAAKPAKVSLKELTMEFNSNNFEIAGVKIDAKSVGEISVNVKNNVDEMASKIKKFVEDYNGILDKLGKTTNEKQNKKFYPLGKDEKKALGEEESKEWTESAKKGILENDFIINNMTQNIRTDLYKNFAGGTDGFKHITDIGISTQRYQKGVTGGKLQINEERLKAALDKDPQKVMDLLFASADEKENVNADGADKRGVFTRIFDGMTKGIEDIVLKSGAGDDSALIRNVKSNILVNLLTKGKNGGKSDIEMEILNIDRTIGKINDSLASKEENLFKKFGRMEAMLQKMQSQGNWIGQQMK